jgi:thioredoxin reductase
MYDLIIIGAGPAGLAAALYATRKRLQFQLVSKDLGGKSNYSISFRDSDENQIIQARELVTVYRSRVESLRHSITLKAVQSVEKTGNHFSVTLGDGTVLEAQTVLVASGTNPNPLGVPGERELLGKALGYSAISYSHVLFGQRVFLCGNSDRVLNSALEISLHTEQVTVALLPDSAVDPRIKARLEKLESVELIENAEIAQFSGDQFATEVRVRSNGTERTIEAEGFFVETDPTANTAFLGSMVTKGENGTVSVDAGNRTKIDGLFAAGDVTDNGFEQVLVALGDGTKAILSIYRYLLEKDLMSGKK